VTFKEAIKVEKYMLSLKGNPRLENEQDASSRKKKTPQAKTPSDKKRSRFHGHGKYAKNCEKISNEIVDLNKNSGEGSSTINYFKPPFKNNFPPKKKLLHLLRELMWNILLIYSKIFLLEEKPPQVGKDEEEEEEGKKNKTNWAMEKKHLNT
jgi:hypothetical protein